MHVHPAEELHRLGRCEKRAGGAGTVCRASPVRGHECRFLSFCFVYRFHAHSLWRPAAKSRVKRSDLE